nr:RNA-directed DNA polymerase, eukaryota, reverse transcriptase zinc-binding domain protein [Tanacetum cinerariifolium]
MDSSASDDDHDMEEHRSTNEDVDPNAAFDDFIQQNIVKESALKDSKEGDLANGSTHVAGDNETHFFGKVKEEYFVTKEDKPSEEDVSDTSKPPGFENFIKENSECSISSNASRSETKMNKLELFQLRSMWGNFNFDYGCSMARGRSGGLVTMWDPNVFVKKRMCHPGKVILFGDSNEVRNESERFGSIFSSGDAAIFNDFIQESVLIDLPMGGRSFTWMNKVGSKMSKLDRFLISDNVNHDNPNLQVVALDRRWSDHNPILLHLKKFDFGPTPFRIFHSWFDRIDFEEVVKDKWDDITREVLGHTKSLHTKLKDLKSHLKIWYSHTKEVETSKMNLLLTDMQNLDQKINEGLASDEDKSSRISKLQELDYFEKMISLDLMQKARVKWEVEGDKNSKFFHGLINSKRKSQSIHDLLEAVVSMEEIKTVVWDCGSNKAPGPDGYSFLFIKRFWDLLKHDIQEFVVSFFSSGKFPQGVNSAFIMLIPKVSNPLFIKDYRPISLIGLHYKIVAKILSNRLSKAPEMVIKSLESLRVNFFWGIHESFKKLSSVKWSNTLASFDKGGLGVGSLSAFNKALLLKWRWRLFNFPNSLWIQYMLITMGRSKTEFDNLIIDISNMEIDDLVESDTCVWSLSNDDSFSMNSVRKHIDEHSLPFLFPCIRWYKMIPKKVNVFMWRMLLDRLPNRLNLSSHGLDIDSISCMVCNGHVESNDHIFFTYDTAVAIWNLVRSWIDLPLSNFLSYEDWTNRFDSWHVSKDKKSRMYSIFAATYWTLWHFRNNITFNSHSMRKCDIFDFIRNVSFS